MSEPTLFDALAPTEREDARRQSDEAKREAGLRKGLAQRDDALVLVTRKADPAWMEAARSAIRRTASELPTFIVDDVFVHIDLTLSTHDQRAIGALMLEAARAKIIARTDRFLPSFRPSHHACPRRVWKSLVFGGK